ncbi:vWA domain-containing protein [Paenibacillus roseipurpureus]|uniref:VWA domain-containing protein n=1 Tax=Paenibacillus roseopurpureus TaxID=2918901 RepID=A0AA96LJV4_9BACL|nr:vWA domain-containing protein [Paenibacillus sp. MBLB1832]WNR42376.1 vWA domain-containing protein [Paenibacillus sp. MBLB1832]
MHWFPKLKKKSAILLAAALLTSSASSLAGTSSVYGAETDNGCLAISGVGNVPVTSVERNQLVTINYTLDPNGTHTVTQTRDPVDIAFVADVSGSMDYHMDKNNSQTPIRIDILKSASATLTNKFKTVNMGDRLGLIKFSSGATKVLDLSTNYTNVQNEINKLSAGGSTNIDDGLAKAKTMLTASGTKPVKQIILLTDGKATVWTDENDGNKQKSGDVSAANAARADADVLAGLGIKVFTIALATPGSDEIDLDLLQYIATKTGGTAYQASSTSQLSSIFDNIAKTIEAPAQLKNVTLRQPIPSGFILAPGENASNVSYDTATHEVVVNVGNIDFPYVQDTIDLSIKVIPDTAAGDYPLQDAKVTYRDACNANRQFNISFNTQLSVSIRIVDKYGNVYIGNSIGEVQRLRNRDKQKQWTIKNKSVAVSDIRFVDTDHSVVRIYYTDGTSEQWDLKPSAPASYELVDGNGKSITTTGWHMGPGTIRSIAGSTNQLPSSAVYANDDFSTSYIAGYENAVNDGNWTTQTEQGATIPDGNSVNFQTRAFTYAISGSTSIPIAGAVATGNVSLDSTGPMVSWSKSIENPTDDGIIYVTATDNLSPVTSVKVWFDNKTISISSSSPKMKKSGNTYAFRLSDVVGFETADKRAGWHQIQLEATSMGGTTSTANSPEYFVVNPGPSAVLKGVNYAAGDISDKPVSVIVTDEKLPVTDRTFGNHTEKGFTLKGMYYVIKQSATAPEAGEWKQLASKRLTVTTKTNTTSGTYYVFLKLVDSSNIEKVQEPLVIQFDTEQYNN